MLTEPSQNDINEIIELIDAVYREYGDSICLEKADSDLLAIDANYNKKGGCFWILKDNNQIIATVALIPAEEENMILLKRLYMRIKYRGTGKADYLLNYAINWAKERGYKKMGLWSDTRFLRGHRFYARHKFIKNGHRSMNDGNIPYQEYFFYREI